jgi:hypothetical protein
LVTSSKTISDMAISSFLGKADLYAFFFETHDRHVIATGPLE